MATKERSTRETGACVRDCQSYRVKPTVFQRTLFRLLFRKYFFPIRPGGDFQMREVYTVLSIAKFTLVSMTK